MGRTSNTSNSKGRKRSSSSSPANSNMWKGSGSKKKKSSSGTGNHHNAAGINVQAAQKMFEELADEDDPQVAGMEGIFKLGEKLGIDATEDIRILVLLWKMNAVEKPSQLSRDEWIQGCESLGIDSWSSLEKQLPGLETGFLEQTEFKDFYKFCFQFNRQGTHRTLAKDLVVALLKLVLKDRIPTERLDSFCTFLEGNAGYSHITLDQWTSFLDFCHELPDNDFLSHYDESTSAWPVLIDEYVEYMEEQQKKQKQKA